MGSCEPRDVKYDGLLTNSFYISHRAQYIFRLERDFNTSALCVATRHSVHSVAFHNTDLLADKGGLLCVNSNRRTGIPTTQCGTCGSIPVLTQYPASTLARSTTVIETES